VESSGGVRKVADISTSSLDAYRLFAQGVDAYDHMRTKDAQRLLTEAVRVDPSFASAYLYLGSVSYFEGRMADRKMYFAKAREHIGRLNERERLLLQANIARAAGDTAEAARVNRSVNCAISGYRRRVRGSVTVVHTGERALYDPEKEDAILRRGIEVVPHRVCCEICTAMRCSSPERFDRSQAELEQYARLSPDEPNPYDSLGEVNLAAMRPEKSSRVLRTSKCHPT
jgi:tetratricopeptide (TPR) repeat protein